MPASRSLAFHRLALIALVLLVLTLPSRAALTQVLCDASTEWVGAPPANLSLMRAA